MLLIAMGARGHRAELQDAKATAVLANPLLSEDGASWGVQANQQGDQRQEGQHREAPRAATATSWLASRPAQDEPRPAPCVPRALPPSQDCSAGVDTAQALWHSRKSKPSQISRQVALTAWCASSGPKARTNSSAAWSKFPAERSQADHKQGAPELVRRATETRVSMTDRASARAGVPAQHRSALRCRAPDR